MSLSSVQERYDEFIYLPSKFLFSFDNQTRFLSMMEHDNDVSREKNLYLFNFIRKKTYIENRQQSKHIHKSIYTFPGLIFNWNSYLISFQQSH
jgi:hypothetical protein